MSVVQRRDPRVEPRLPSPFRSQRDEEGPAEEAERSSHEVRAQESRGASAKVRSAQQRGGGRGHGRYSSCRVVRVSVLGKGGFGKE